MTTDGGRGLGLTPLKQTPTIPTHTMRHFLNIADHPPETLRHVLEVGLRLRGELQAGQAHAPLLAGKSLAMLFQKPSLRTRVGFEQAMSQLGGHALVLGQQEVGLGQRESVGDVTRVLGGMVDAIAARVFRHEHLVEMSASATVPVINMLSDRSHPAQALADAMGCVRRTVYRARAALMLAGFPVVSEKREGRVYYRFLESFGLGDAPFTTDEVIALAFSEDLLRSLEGTVFHDSIRSALGKIRAGLGPQLAGFLERLGESFRVLPGPHKRYAHQRETIHTLNQAVLGRRTVKMRYRTARTGKLATRKLDPYRVWYRSGGLYVIGRDHRSGEIRTFAVDRVRSAELLDEGFSIPESFDFDAYTASAFGVVSEPPTRVRIRFDPPWALQVEERSWHPSQKLERTPDGSLILTLEVGGTEELRSWVLSFGGGAEVLEPAALRAGVAQELKAALARYECAAP